MSLVRRIQALLDHLEDEVPVAVLRRQLGFSPPCFYEWLTALILDGLNSLGYLSSGGREAKLTPTRKKHLGELIDAGPEAAGFESSCWTLRGSYGDCWVVPLSVGDNSAPLTSALPWLIITHTESW